MRGPARIAMADPSPAPRARNLRPRQPTDKAGSVSHAQVLVRSRQRPTCCNTTLYHNTTLSQWGGADPLSAPGGAGQGGGDARPAVGEPLRAGHRSRLVAGRVRAGRPAIRSPRGAGRPAPQPSVGFVRCRSTSVTGVHTRAVGPVRLATVTSGLVALTPGPAPSGASPTWLHAPAASRRRPGS
jgi:hypothetical protein